ncbi:hypothetical protein [Mesorhizobium sp.]|uniref:hypothetical protein n=1 Tax=Mesorhizobium sp. TaxID=1871066 RepID=UPI0012043A73|nr:hypothetical protein [Mesorhizobium sp.]TIO10357.1 MAG: hypothetical protein E5X88_04520 [Mesorhizobium sp.]TIO36698.1 MAG: hypothetical protein E5X89_01465 [Mesorhizobium sp.]
MEKENLDLEGLAEVPVRQLSKFLRVIAEYNLWDEVEQQLRAHGCDKVLMSFEPVRSIGAIAEARARELAGKRPDTPSKLARCGCNGPLGPRPGPVTPGGSNAGAGSDGGSTRPRWLAVRVDSFVERIERSSS